MLLAILTAAGCRTFSLPRIDPTGERLFLPDPYRVGLSDAFTHTDRNGLPQKHGLVPNSAFPAPLDPPPCIDGTEPNKKGCGLLEHYDRGECGQLLLTPTTIVAPVGGEVVLLAGICGEDGYLVTKEPIEWMLSPESVGTFIEVGDDAKGRPLQQLHAKNKVQKLDVDYAKGRTSSIETLITRGSPRTTDDLPIKKGQTWISLSSPAEGTSRVTALAPDSEVWDQRRQTATIYWVDAQWRFPDPVTTQTGQNALLSTQVFQSEGFVAARNWKVLYRSLNPEVAKFLPSGSDVAEVTVGEDGRANIEVQNISNSNATAIIAVEVIRPAQERMAALTLGRGQTVVTWSAPRIVVQGGGPEVATPGQRLTYGASLINDGDLPAENTALQIAIPAGLNIVDADPKPTRQAPNGVVWEFGQLQAREARNVTLIVEAAAPVEGRIQFSGAGMSSIQPGQGIQTQDSKGIDIRVATPTLQLRMEPGQTSPNVEVNREVNFNVSVVNSGRTALNNIRLQIVSDPGLQEAATNDNNIAQIIPYLGAGEKRDLTVRYRVMREGELRATLTASTNDVKIAETQAFVRGTGATPSVPGISIELVPEGGQVQVDVQGNRQVTARVTNTGQVVLSNVGIQVQFDDGLIATSATQGAALNELNRILTWQVPTPLNPGDRVEVSVLFQVNPNRGAGQGAIQARVTSGQGVQADNALRLNLGSGSVLPNQGGNAPVLPNNNPGSVLPNGAGAPVLPNGAAAPVALEIVRPTAPAVMNQPTTLIVRATNLTQVDDRNMVLTIRTEPGVAIESLTEIRSGYAGSFKNNSWIESERVATVRPSETLAWSLTVRPTPSVADLKIQATVTSNAVPTGVTRIDTIPIIAN